MTGFQIGGFCVILNILIVFAAAECDSSVCKVCDNSTTCTECIEGRHGINCGRFCSLKCSGKCRQSDGYCTSGCDEGYWGPGGLCDKTCSNCNPGGCVMDTGLCIATGCQTGWWGTTCSTKCHNNCNGGCNPTNGNCNQCIDGKYGTNCQSDCSYCKDTCNINNGLCNNGCKDGFWGTSCSETCPNCQSGGCDIENGNCNNPGCQIGWYGDNCNDKCNERCIEGCNQDTGQCSKCNKGIYGNLCDKNCNNGCLDGCNIDGSCKCKPTYYGTDCSKPCSNNCVESLCNEIVVGLVRCIRECIVGYWGIYCEIQCPPSCPTCNRNDGSCVECFKGFYGSQCHLNCPETCSKCNINNGGCESCSPKYHGIGCSTRCSDKCLNGECEEVGGRCIDCIPGTFGDYCHSVCSKGCIVDSSSSCYRNGSCITGCINGRYGEMCNLNCSRNCNGSCDRNNGYCNSCLSGYFGDNCNQICPVNCYGDCEKTTGNCGKCNKGYFGDNCNQTCSINCNGGCEKSSGNCFNCKIGFHGDYCKQQCNDNCINNECSRNGQCKSGCINGKTGSQCDGNCSSNCTICLQTDGNICEECKPGFYGLSCDKLCNNTCNKVNSKPSCNITSGECTSGCDSGFYGNYCDLKCSANCNNQLCNQATGFCKDGCVDGKHGNNCSLDCNAGFYGGNCINKCGQCFNKTVCNPKSGVCGIEGCQEGFKGSWCKTVISKQAGESEDTIIIAAVVTVVLVLIIAVVIVIAVLVYRRRRSKQNSDAILSIPFSDEIDKDNPVYIEENVALQSTPPTIYANMTDDESIAVYQNVTTQSPTMINLSDLWDYTEDKKAAAKFPEEFEKLPKDLCRPHDICLNEVNREKNRYKNICAFDDTRVKLQPIDNDPNSDYINACYITKYGTSTEKNIASQGPNEVNIEEFVRMIWDVDACKIVMLTNLVELAIVKCLKYWPNLGKKKVFGKITVKFQKEDVFAHFTIREFKICKENCVSRTVKQYHYTSWPDKGVPSDIASLVEFRNKVNKSPSRRSGPMIVHCSAGIGRTGTFLALDYLIQQAQAENSVDIFSCVSQMRQERVNMVQTVTQYTLLHDALTVWYIADGTTTSGTNYPQIYNQLLQQDTHNNISQLQLKYQLMNKISCKIDKDGYSEALQPENKNKNRDQHVLAANSKRLYLSPSGNSTDYINAVYMPSYKKKQGYVLTQTPLSTTVNDFWEMIMSSGSTVVIDMEPRAKSKDIGNYVPGENSFDIESISITKDKIEEHESGYFDVITCTVNDSSGSEDVKRIVKIYKCRCWDTDTNKPDSSIPYFTLLDEIFQWSNSDNLGPLVIHCLNGVNKSGLLCVLAAILERLTIEQDVSIVQTILQLRISRPEIINSFEQFQFCFEAIGEYLDNFSNYVNSY